MLPSFKAVKAQNGSAMVVVLIIMAILSIIGVHAIAISTGEQKITTNLTTQKAAFYDADSGVQFTLASLENSLLAGTAGVLPISTGPENAVAFAGVTPDGFSFQISDIEMAATNVYAFTSTGFAENAYGNADVVINATFRRGVSNPFKFAAFGDKKMELKNSGITYSYDSRNPDNDFDNPESLISAHEADVGSNEYLITKYGSQIDGDGVIGATLDDNNPATDETGEYDINNGTDFYGDGSGDPEEDYIPLSEGRINPDPLGIDAPDGVYNPASYSSTGIYGNDNEAYGTITGKKGTSPLSESGGSLSSTKYGDIITLRGKPGGSNFYFTDVVLANSVQMKIDTSNGPVNIFIDGGQFNAKNGSITNLDASGNLGSDLDFAIYSNTESESSSADVILHNSSEFSGVIYAPKANIEMKNSADMYGAVWGREIVFHNSFTLFYDEALQDKYSTVSNNLSLISWEEE